MRTWSVTWVSFYCAGCCQSVSAVHWPWTWCTVLHCCGSHCCLKQFCSIYSFQTPLFEPTIRVHVYSMLLEACLLCYQCLILCIVYESHLVLGITVVMSLVHISASVSFMLYLWLYLVHVFYSVCRKCFTTKLYIMGSCDKMILCYLVFISAEKMFGSFFRVSCKIDIMMCLGSM